MASSGYIQGPDRVENNADNVRMQCCGVPITSEAMLWTLSLGEKRSDRTQTKESGQQPAECRQCKVMQAMQALCAMNELSQDDHMYKQGRGLVGGMRLCHLHNRLVSDSPFGKLSQAWRLMALPWTTASFTPPPLL